MKLAVRKSRVSILYGSEQKAIIMMFLWEASREPSQRNPKLQLCHRAENPGDNRVMGMARDGGLDSAYALR